MFNIFIIAAGGVVKRTYNGSNLKYINECIAEEFKTHGDVDISIKKHSKGRSLDANAQAQVWYGEIAKYTDRNKKTVEARTKIDFGIPILLRDVDKGGYPAVLNWMLEKLDFWNLTLERQEILITGIAVTREMSTKQHNEYRDNVQDFWNGLGLYLGYL